MLLVDSSMWIGFIRNPSTIPRNPDLLSRFVTCGPVLQEVLQGLRPGAFNEQLQESMLALPRIGDPLNLDTFLAAADIYRRGRARGITIRSTIDCLIAAIALQHDATVWHQGRDFEAIATFTSLKALSRDIS